MIAAVDYCHACAEAFLEPIRARHIAVDEGPIGVGHQTGPLRPDWGEKWAELACTICSATWVGPIGEPCSWCIARHEAIIDAQRAVLLRPDLPDADDRDRPRALRVWAERLAHAVNAGIVDEHEARAAIEREDNRHAA